MIDSLTQDRAMARGFAPPGKQSVAEKQGQQPRPAAIDSLTHDYRRHLHLRVCQLERALIRRPWLPFACVSGVGVVMLAGLVVMGVWHG